MMKSIDIRWLNAITALGTVILLGACASGVHGPSMLAHTALPPDYDSLDREQYTRVEENTFLSAMAHPVSTFSIDVDTASYSNVRRFIHDGRLPPKDAVRIEELVNYFAYDYPEPQADHPFSVTTEIASCPWNRRHRLVQIGLKGRSLDQAHLPPANLVFLIDVSGSMHGRLPLVKAGLRLLVKQLRPQDRVAIVVYAGAAGMVLPPTPGHQQASILAAIEWLEAGGSTAGGAGIELAYAVAREHYRAEGTNRVILATDGDFNVGPTSRSALHALIEEKRRHGVFLTVLGFGRGNVNDATMELLADKGNGNYAYIDSLLEAKKVLVNEMGSTLSTIAKDVKIQVQFNPVSVDAYRLIGYENRLLARRDFTDDAKDAGEIGAGHTVTALYEIVPAGGAPQADSLVYVETAVRPEAMARDEVLTVNLRYKLPEADRSRLVTHALRQSAAWPAQVSNDLLFASAVAEFGMLLRDSRYKAAADYSTVIRRARAASGADPHGYRAEFIRLVEAAEAIGE